MDEPLAVLADRPALAPAPQFLQTTRPFSWFPVHGPFGSVGFQVSGTRRGYVLTAVWLSAGLTLCGCHPHGISEMPWMEIWDEPHWEPVEQFGTVALTAGGPNPVVIPAPNQEFFWEGLVDVVDDYFRIQREDRVRQIGNVLVEGKIQTFPLTGATVLEPWRKDSVGPANRWESTFQSIRRIALISVIPTAGGYLVEVQVHKELENVQRPERAAATTAAVEFKASLDRVDDSLDEPPPTLGWIGVGRDLALEQRILADLRARFGVGG